MGKKKYQNVQLHIQLTLGEALVPDQCLRCLTRALHRGDPRDIKITPLKKNRAYPRPVNPYKRVLVHPLPQPTVNLTLTVHWNFLKHLTEIRGDCIHTSELGDGFIPELENSCFVKSKATAPTCMVLYCKKNISSVKRYDATTSTNLKIIIFYRNNRLLIPETTRPKRSPRKKAYKLWDGLFR